MDKIAVIGSGVMGSAIAAHIANSGTPVTMLDVVPEGAKNRNIFAESAVERMLNEEKSPFSLRSNAQLITCGNLEDNLDLLKDTDWIIEAVVERLEVKQEIYHKLQTVRKPGSIVSSNTSTIPLAELVQGMSDDFRQDMLITHFFNPPRTMRLMELVTHAETHPKHITTIQEFADIRLGKTVVHAKDTPGFIANRIGIFWLMMALETAMEMKITVEEVDSLLSAPIGIPKTGVFALIDLVGVDLIPLMAESMLMHLPADDHFHAIYKEPSLVRRMTNQGYTGRKGKGGFYRLVKEHGEVQTEVIDFITGQYRPIQKPVFESIHASTLKSLVTAPDKGGEYAWAVMSEVLSYAISLVPEIADSIDDVDTAMRMGFNWKYGPFALIDQLGPIWFKEQLQAEGRPVPPLLETLGELSFYKERSCFSYDKATPYRTLPILDNAWKLAALTYKTTPIIQNNSARLWDIGNGIACLEFTTKMNVIDLQTFSLIEEALERVGKEFDGLVIGNDSDHFSVGLNLNLVLESAEKEDYAAISALIRKGQQVMQHIKYAPFPVVLAVSGMALGGACEMLLHADAVQAHIDSTIGLVETHIGLVPGWGGCTSMLFNRLNNAYAPDEVMNAVFSIFEMIAFARKSSSAEEAREWHILNQHSRISMNRQRLLADAKNLCLSLVKDYHPPTPPILHIPGSAIKAALGMTLFGLKHSSQLSPHAEAVLGQLTHILSGGGVDINEALTEERLMDLEHDAFMRLVQQQDTLKRIKGIVRH